MTCVRWSPVSQEEGTVETPSSYLEHKGVKTFGAGDNCLRFACPGCNRTETFEFNTLTGQWKCSPPGCGIHGSLYRLKVLWGDAMALTTPKPATEESWVERAEQAVTEWSEALRSSAKAEPARKYLELRGFDPQNGACELGRLGWKPPINEEDSTGWLTIPVFATSVSAVKLRKIPPNDHPKPYRNLSHSTKSLYCPLGIRPGKTLVLLGGELDVLSVIQAYLRDGYSPSDMPYDFACPPDYQSLGVIADDIADVEDIVLLMPSTQEGKAATTRAVTTYGRWRCRVGEWPQGKDANALLSVGDLDSFAVEAKVKSAKAQGFGGVAPAKAYGERVKRWVATTRTQCYSTGYPTLDSYLGGGLPPGSTTLLVAPTGHGKTAFITSIINHVVGQRRGVFVCPTEEGVEAQLYYGAYHHHGLDPAGEGDCDTLIDRYLDWAGPYLVPLDHTGPVHIPTFLETLRYAIHRLDISLVAIDNRDKMIPRRTTRDNRWDLMAELGEGVVDVVSKTPAHCLLVVQTDKRKGRVKTQAPESDDIKGMSDTIQDAHAVVSMHAPRDQSGGFLRGADGLYGADVYVRKVRDRRGRTGKVPLRFERKSQRYFDPRSMHEQASPF